MSLNGGSDSGGTNSGGSSGSNGGSRKRVRPYDAAAREYQRRYREKNRERRREAARARWAAMSYGRRQVAKRQHREWHARNKEAELRRSAARYANARRLGVVWNRLCAPRSLARWSAVLRWSVLRDDVRLGRRAAELQ